MFPYDDNPDFATLRAAHQTQHGVTIAYIKKQVGEGMEYANEVASAVLSEQGGYYQLTEMPEEFAGALGEGVSHRLVAVAEAWQVLRELETLIEGVRQGTQKVRSLSLYVLYAGGSLQTRQGVFVFDQTGEDCFSHGQWQPQMLPRFFKLRLDCGDSAVPPKLGLTRGVVFFLAPQGRDDGRSLLATLARTPAMQDLGILPLPTTIN